MGSRAKQQFVRARIITGTYTGNSADNRNIDIGIDLASKSNVYVLIKSNAANEIIHRIEYGQGDLAMTTTGGDFANYIQLFNNTGFQVGSDNNVNGSTFLYRYIVFWEEP